jgi:hypothetical protein
MAAGPPIRLERDAEFRARIGRRRREADVALKQFAEQFERWSAASREASLSLDRSINQTMLVIAQSYSVLSLANWLLQREEDGIVFAVGVQAADERSQR